MMSIPFLFVATFVVSTSGKFTGTSICDGYAECVEMDFTVKSNAANCGGACTVEACMKRVSCWKSGGLSHVCSSTADCASSPDTGATALTETILDFKIEGTQGFTEGQTICATGKPGEYVHFAIKDATYVCDGGNDREVTFKAGGKGKCHNWSTAFGSCSGNNENQNIQATCAYSVQLPLICGDNEGSGGNGGSDGNGETQGCCLDTVAPSCKFVADSYPGSMTVDFPDSDAQGLADGVFKDYECEKPSDSCNVVYCKKHIPAEVFTQFGGTECGDVV